MVAHQAGSKQTVGVSYMSPNDIFPQKTCSACDQSLPIDRFGKAPAYRDGHCGQCKSCRSKRNAAYVKANPSKRAKTDPAITRRAKLKSKYGISPEEFEQMSLSQNGCCAICGGGPNGRWPTLVVDHCHETNQVRGLLCHLCNVNLGRVGDSLVGLMRYVDYLRRQA